MHGTHTIRFGDFVGYTLISWAHDGSLRKLSTEKDSIGKNIFSTQENIFSGHSVGPTSQLPRSHDEGQPEWSKKWAQFFWSIMATKICVRQIVEQV